MILDNALLVFTQVLILFLLIAVGFFTRKIRMLDEHTLMQLNNLLLMVVTPSIIVKSFQVPFDAQLVRYLLIALVSSIGAHTLGAVLSWFAFRRQPEAQKKVLNFAVIFSNCAFMCLPILDAVLGSRGVLFGSVYIMTFNLFQWTYGVVLMSGNQNEIKLRKALLNPGTVAILISLILFLAQIKLPSIPMAVINQMANLNTPLAMLIIGAQLATISLASLFNSLQVYKVAILRLLVVPVVVLLVLHAFPMDRILLLACLIPAAMPTGAGTTLFAGKFGQDIVLSTRAIALTTLFSCLTIPALILVSDLIGYWQ